MVNEVSVFRRLVATLLCCLFYDLLYGESHVQLPEEYVVLIQTSKTGLPVEAMNKSRALGTDMGNSLCIKDGTVICFRKAKQGITLNIPDMLSIR